MPVLSDLYSLQGLIQLSETLDEVRKKSNPDLRAAGILLTRYNPRERISTLIRETSAEIAQRLDIPLLDTTIRSSVMLTGHRSCGRILQNTRPRTRRQTTTAGWWMN